MSEETQSTVEGTLIREDSSDEKSQSATKAQTVLLRQRDYVPTPYSVCSWEFVGERPKSFSFESLDLEVLREDELMSDPMFESFDPPKAMFTGPSDEGIGAEGGTNGQSGIDPEELEALLAEKFEEGRQVGLAEGRDEIDEKVTASYEALNARMVEITKGIESEVAEHVGSLQKKALEFALEIARKILKTTAEIKPEYIYDIIRKGVDSLGAAEPIKIRVSLDDYEFLDVIGLPSDINEGELGVRYVADENISSGCVIETNYGEISLELDTMWEQVRDNLFPKG